MSVKKIKVPELGGCGFISVYFDSELGEYQVRVRGNKDATYFTDDKVDAVRTAQVMRNSVGSLLNAGEN